MKSYWQKCSEDTIFEMRNNEVSIDLMHNFIGQFSASKTPWKIVLYNFQHPRSSNLEKAIYLFQDQNSLIVIKKVTLYHLMTKSHSISTKMIPIHTFVNAFPNFNPRMHILSFLNCASTGGVKNCTKPIFRVSWKLRKCKNISVHQIIWYLKTHHFKYGILTTFLSIAFPILILE